MPAMSGWKIVIRGLGLITPLGTGPWAVYRALMQGRTLADRASALPADVAGFDLVRALGSVSIAQHAGGDPSVELAEHAARQALTDAGVEASNLPCFLGVSKGAMHALASAAGTLLGTHPHFPPPRLREAHLAVTLGPAGFLAHELRRRLKLGIVLPWIAACASSLTALHHARLAMLHDTAGDFKRVLVLTSEAALLPQFIGSYANMGVLPPLTAKGYRGCPLDDQRAGFMLAEQGAAVLLERAEQVRSGEMELVSTAAANEACDLVQPSKDMQALTHVAASLLGGEMPAMLHPHATGTQDHDPAELAAYARVLGRGRPALYACKGALGHGLGAAGLVSLVLAAVIARTRKAPPMPWLQSPASTDWNLKAAPGEIPAGPHAVFAAGFAGHVAGAVIRIQR